MQENMQNSYAKIPEREPKAITVVVLNTVAITILALFDYG